MNDEQYEQTVFINSEYMDSQLRPKCRRWIKFFGVNISIDLTFVIPSRVLIFCSLFRLHFLSTASIIIICRGWYVCPLAKYPKKNIFRFLIMSILVPDPFSSIFHLSSFSSRYLSDPGRRHHFSNDEIHFSYIILLTIFRAPGHT